MEAPLGNMETQDGIQKSVSELQETVRRKEAEAADLVDLSNKMKTVIQRKEKMIDILMKMLLSERQQNKSSEDKDASQIRKEIMQKIKMEEECSEKDGVIPDKKNIKISDTEIKQAVSNIPNEEKNNDNSDLISDVKLNESKEDFEGKKQPAITSDKNESKKENEAKTHPAKTCNKNESEKENVTKNYPAQTSNKNEGVIKALSNWSSKVQNVLEQISKKHSNDELSLEINNKEKTSPVSDKTEVIMRSVLSNCVSEVRDEDGNYEEPNDHGLQSVSISPQQVVNSVSHNVSNDEKQNNLKATEIEKASIEIEKPDADDESDVEVVTLDDDSDNEENYNLIEELTTFVSKSKTDIKTENITEIWTGTTSDPKEIPSVRTEYDIPNVGEKDSDEIDDTEYEEADMTENERNITENESNITEYDEGYVTKDNDSFSSCYVDEHHDDLEPVDTNSSIPNDPLELKNSEKLKQTFMELTCGLKTIKSEYSSSPYEDRQEGDLDEDFLQTNFLPFTSQEGNIVPKKEKEDDTSIDLPIFNIKHRNVEEKETGSAKKRKRRSVPKGPCCEGCEAPKCMECGPCINKRWKKRCLMRKCMKKE